MSLWSSQHQKMRKWVIRWESKERERREDRGFLRLFSSLSFLFVFFNVRERVREMEERRE